MKIPTVSIKQLLEAGVHLGHKTFRWNPKMSKYIFGSKNSIHIIDLVQTVELTNAALLQVHKCISSGGKILFVSTKKQAAETISTLANETGQYHVTHRWLGGMLTNWKTISNSIKRYKKLSVDLQKDSTGFTKKENLKMGIQRDKLERSLGGIADMKKIPDMMFVIDVNVESLAIKEALKFCEELLNEGKEVYLVELPGKDPSEMGFKEFTKLVQKATPLNQFSLMEKKIMLI